MFSAIQEHKLISEPADSNQQFTRVIFRAKQIRDDLRSYGVDCGPLTNDLEHALHKHEDKVNDLKLQAAPASLHLDPNVSLNGHPTQSTQVRTSNGFILLPPRENQADQPSPESMVVIRQTSGADKECSMADEEKRLENVLSCLQPAVPPSPTYEPPPPILQSPSPIVQPKSSVLPSRQEDSREDTEHKSITMKYPKEVKFDFPNRKVGDYWVPEQGRYRASSREQTRHGRLVQYAESEEEKKRRLRSSSRRRERSHDRGTSLYHERNSDKEKVRDRERSRGRESERESRNFNSQRKRRRSESRDTEHL